MNKFYQYLYFTKKYNSIADLKKEMISSIKEVLIYLALLLPSWYLIPALEIEHSFLSIYNLFFSFLYVVLALTSVAGALNGIGVCLQALCLAIRSKKNKKILKSIGQHFLYNIKELKSYIEPIMEIEETAKNLRPQDIFNNAYNKKQFNIHLKIFIETYFENMKTLKVNEMIAQKDSIKSNPKSYTEFFIDGDTENIPLKILSSIDKKKYLYYK